MQIFLSFIVGTTFPFDIAQVILSVNTSHRHLVTCIAIHLSSTPKGKMSNFGRFGRDFNRQAGREGEYRGYVPERDMHSRFTGDLALLDDYQFVQRSGPRGDMDNLRDRLDQVRIAAFRLEELERLSLRENERIMQREIMEQEARARMCRGDQGYGRYGGEEHFRSQQLYHEPARAQPGPVFPLSQQNLRILNGSGSRNSPSDQSYAFGTSQPSSTPTFQYPEPQRDRHPASAGRQSPFWSSDLTQSSSRTSQTSSRATLQPNQGYRSHRSSSSHATTNPRAPNSSSRSAEAGSTPCIPNHQASSQPPTVASASARAPTTSRSASSNHHSHHSGHPSTNDSSRWEPMLQPETKDCIACLDPHPIDDFPPITPTCTHLPTLCTSCVQDALTATALNPLTINRLRCMHQGCTELLSHGDIRRLATPDTFER